MFLGITQRINCTSENLQMTRQRIIVIIDASQNLTNEMHRTVQEHFEQNVHYFMVVVG